MAETGEGRRRAELNRSTAGCTARGLEITLQLPIQTIEDRLSAAEQLRQLAAMLEAGRTASARAPSEVPPQAPMRVREQPAPKRGRRGRRAASEANEMFGVSQEYLDRMKPDDRVGLLRGYQGRLSDIAGGSNALLDLLVRFGVSRVSELPAPRHLEFIEAVRAAYRALSTR